MPLDIQPGATLDVQPGQPQKKSLDIKPGIAQASKLDIQPGAVASASLDIQPGAVEDQGYWSEVKQKESEAGEDQRAVLDEMRTQGVSPGREFRSAMDAMQSVFAIPDVAADRYLGRPGQKYLGVPAWATDFLAEVALPGGAIGSARKGYEALKAGESLGPAAYKAAKAFAPEAGKAVKEVAQLPFKLARGTIDFAKDVKKFFDSGKPIDPELAEAQAMDHADKTASKKLEEDLRILKKQKESDYIQVMKEGQSTPEEIKNLQNQRALYIKRESAKGGGDIFNDEHYVDPATQEWYDKRISRYDKEAEDDYRWLAAHGYKEGDFVKPDTYDEVQRYVHKVAKGFGHAFDKVTEPLRVRLRSLSKRAGALKSRTMLALQRDDGKRRVIAVIKNGRGFSIFENGKPVPIERSLGQDIKKGGTWTDDDGRLWKITDATTEEIKAETPVDYHQNILATSMENWVTLKTARRNAEFLEKTRADLIKKGLATTDKNKAPDSWRTTKMPQFGGYWLPKRIAEVLDDFYSSGMPGGIEKINQFIVGAMLLNPIPHTENMLALWMNARGWENFTPSAYLKLVKTIAPSINDVYSKSDLYVEVLKKGGFLQYPKQVMGDWVKTLFPKAIEAAKTDTGWQDIVLATGMKVPQFFKTVADAMHKTVWFSSDVLYMQLIREMKLNGMSTDEAIKYVNQVMVSYQMPSRIADSRFLSETLNTPLFIFPRWIYGLGRSLASQIQRSLSHDPAEMERAVGQLFALGFMCTVLKPMADDMLRKITGNVYAEWRAFGPEKFPMAVEDFVEQNKNKDYRDLIYSVFEVSPAAGLFMQIFGKYVGAYPIVEPDDFFAALQGDPDAIENVALQLSDYGITVTQPLELIKSISTGFEGFWQGMAEEAGAQLPSDERIARREKRKEEQEKGEEKRDTQRRDQYGLPQ
jgi:hypothetical protein